MTLSIIKRGCGIGGGACRGRCFGSVSGPVLSCRWRGCGGVVSGAVPVSGGRRGYCCRVGGVQRRGKRRGWRGHSGGCGGHYGGIRIGDVVSGSSRCEE